MPLILFMSNEELELKVSDDKFELEGECNEDDAKVDEQKEEEEALLELVGLYNEFEF